MIPSLYFTSEPLWKISAVFLSLKHFRIIDIPEMIAASNLDIGRTTSVYYINKLINESMSSALSVKGIMGVIYINSNLTAETVGHVKDAYKDSFCRCILLDNGEIPSHKNIWKCFDEILFFERFHKIKFF